MGMPVVEATENRAYRAFQDRYRDDPVGFVTDCILWRNGEGPAPYQNEILEAIPKHRRVSARGPHGLGKSTLAAWAIHWFALTRDGTDWKIPATASVWRQLSAFLFPEIHKWARRLNWERIGRPPYKDKDELLTLALHLSTGSAFALASDQPTALEGAHADHILYVFDESKAISSAIFDAAEGAFSTGESYALAISTPGASVGRFYDIQSRRAGYEDWWVRAVRLHETIQAGRISQEWADARKRQWGEASPVYQTRVLGDFATGDTGSVIPLAWVEAANERWHVLRESNLLTKEFRGLGVDVAWTGDDRSVIAPRYGNSISELITFAKVDPMALTGHVVAYLDKHKRPGVRRGYAIVDVIGIGAGVVARLRELHYPTVAYNAGAGTDLVDIAGELGFVDKRSAAWWRMREMLDPQNGFGVALPPDDELTGELVSPTWKVTSTGKIRVESKDDLRKADRLGRSPDKADAVIQAFWDEEPDDGVPAVHVPRRLSTRQI
jgi:hypothetical protein